MIKTYAIRDAAGAILRILNLPAGDDIIQPLGPGETIDEIDPEDAGRVMAAAVAAARVL